MAINAAELRRLHEVAALDPTSCDEQWHLLDYLQAHVPEILEALDDRERIERLQEEQVDTIYMDDGGMIDVGGRPFMGNLRAAIDSRRGKK